MLNLPTLNWLKVFEAAARHNSFTHAADELHMSPSAVSQQIAALEVRLRQKLFERHGKRISLTDAGKSYFPVVQQSLQAISVATSSLFGNRELTPLSIQVNYVFACSWLASRLHSFRSLYPGVQLQLQTGNHADDFSPKIAELRIKLGTKSEATLAGDLLLGEKVYPVATPAIAKSINSSRDLLHHELIEIIKHPSGWYQIFEQNTGTDWQSVRFCYTDTTQMALAMAGAGHGIALARAPVTDDLLARYELVPCCGIEPIDSALYHYLSYDNFAQLSPSALYFREWLLGAVGQST